MEGTAELSAEELLPIAQLCDGEPTFRQDGWRKLVHIPQLHFYVQDECFVMDALLCLNHNNPTYPTKLYFSEKLNIKLNWNEDAFILGRQWFTFSWANVHPNQPIIDILAAHLAPISKGGA